MPLLKAAANLLGRLRNSQIPARRIPLGYLPNPAKSPPGGYSRETRTSDGTRWILLSAQAAILLTMSPTSAAMAESDESNAIGLRKIEDGSVVSNIHTSKWRIFTDNAREFFLQGKLDQAEKLFVSALQEAKQGFGERDPHVASACNNLAELYRLKKAFDKAEPLYMEAINILEQAFGQDDVRVGAGLHNLGQLYLVQRNLERAHGCYERALKIKRRVLGEAHPDYADTMYHLGTVLFLQGKEKDAEALIWDSIRILDDQGGGDSARCNKRLQHLADMYTRSNWIAEAENVLRKILHRFELSKGWNSLDTVLAAERLALTLESLGRVNEALELLERCLVARRGLLPEDDVQIAGNMLHIARVKILNSNQLRNMSISQALTELDVAKDFLVDSSRVALQVLHQSMKGKGKNQLPKFMRDRHSAMRILLQSLDTLGLLEVRKLELLESRGKEKPSAAEAEKAFLGCIRAFEEFGNDKPLVDSVEVKTAYLACMKHLLALMTDKSNLFTQQCSKTSLEELKAGIGNVELELSAKQRRTS